MTQSALILSSEKIERLTTLLRLEPQESPSLNHCRWHHLINSIHVSSSQDIQYLCHINHSPYPLEARILRRVENKSSFFRYNSLAFYLFSFLFFSNLAIMYKSSVHSHHNPHSQATVSPETVSFRETKIPPGNKKLWNHIRLLTTLKKTPLSFPRSRHGPFTFFFQNPTKKRD